MPTIVFSVCGMALIVMVPIMLYLFVFRLPHLRRKENERRKKALGIPTTSPLNILEMIREEKEDERAALGFAEQREAYRLRLMARLTKERQVKLAQLMSQPPPLVGAHSDISPLFHEELVNSSMERLYWGLHLKYLHDAERGQGDAQLGKAQS